MSRFHTIFLTLFFVSGGACALSEQTESTTTPPPTTQPPTTQPPTTIPTHPEGQHSFATCDLSVQDDVEVLWSNTRINPSGFFMAGRGFFSFSPQPGLLTNAQGGTGVSPSTLPWHIDNEQSHLGFNYVYATTGETAFLGPMLTPFGVDDNWLIRLTYDNNQEDPLNPKLQVRWLITNNLLFEAEPAPRPEHVGDNIIPRIFGALTPSGEKLITFTCWPGQQTGVVTSFELPSGMKSDDVVIENHDGCGNGFSRVPSIIPTPNGSGAILQNDYSGNLTYVDLKDGGVIEQQVVDLEDESIWEEAPFFFGSHGILDAVIHPDGDRLATVTVTGDLSFWSLPDFELIGEPIKIGIAGINLNTYMPSSVSPLKFSPDGSLIAHMGIDGSVVLRDTQTLETVTELWVPEIEAATESPEGGSHLVAGNASLDFAFSRDGSAFAVNSALTTTLFGCRDWDIEGEPTELKVELDGPTKLAVDEPGTFVATHIGGHHIHGHQFFVNNVAISTMTTGREFTWVPEKAGTFTVTVVIDDGFNLGEVSMDLIVE